MVVAFIYDFERRLPMKIYENIGLCFYIAWAISPNVALNHLNSTHKLKPTLSSLQNKGNFMKRSLLNYQRH